MAGIIELTSAIPGFTDYAIIHNASGQYWNGSSFETFNATNWSNYVTALTEDRSGANGSGYYKATFPSTITAGRYTFTFYQQSGGSPAFGDTTIGSGGPMYWTGTQEDQGISSAIPELTGIPSATPTLQQAIMLLYMSLRNAHKATSTLETISNDAGTGITTAALSDDSVTYTKAKFS